MTCTRPQESHFVKLSEPQLTVSEYQKEFIYDVKDLRLVMGAVCQTMYIPYGDLNQIDEEMSKLKKIYDSATFFGGTPEEITENLRVIKADVTAIVCDPTVTTFRSPKHNCIMNCVLVYAFKDEVSPEGDGYCHYGEMPIAIVVNVLNI